MDSWKILSEEEAFAAPPFVRVVRQAVELPDGRVVDDFYQVKLRTFAQVVPVCEDGRILMLEQYKHGPGRLCLSFPSGFVDPGEAPRDGAIRELREETGHAPGKITATGDYVDNGNQRGCHGFYHVAFGCHPVTAPNSGDLEEMRLVRLTVPDVDSAMRDGRLGVSHDVAGWGLARVLYGDRLAQGG